jgi:eukaryotic-like serine/threonine-protein kinase
VPPEDDIRPSLRRGPYRTEEVLGRGGMGVVHVVRSVGPHDTGERFAAKRILPEFAQSPAFVRMFYREAELGRKLEHPNIVRVVDFGEQDGELLLVTEHVDGTSCSRMLAKVRKRQECFPLPVALEIACEVLEGLAYTHEREREDGSPLGVVHRDVSPGNILLGAMGEVKLADFGVAQSRDRALDTLPGTLKGKLGYMSPEQVDSVDIDGRSDLFSLGVVLFEVLTGRPFFTGRDDFEILGQMHEGTLTPLAEPHGARLPFELRMILATALAADRRERFRDAREFCAALRAFARHAGQAIERRALVQWLRLMDIWPVRSGTYRAVDRPTVSEVDTPEAERNGRGRSPRG